MSLILEEVYTFKRRLLSDAIWQVLRVSNKWKHVHECRCRLATPSVRYGEFLISESMYMSTSSDNAIYQVLRISYNSRHVHVEVIRKLTLSARYWGFLYVKACTCRCRMIINAIFQALTVYNRRKYVHVEAAWRLTPSVRYWVCYRCKGPRVEPVVCQIKSDFYG